MSVKNHLRTEYLAVAAMLLILASLAGCDVPRASYGIEPVHIDSSNFQQVVLDSEQPVLIDVWMENCPPCRWMVPEMEELAADFENTAVIGKLKAEDSPELANQLGIRAFPTVLIYYKGELVYTDTGFRSKGEMTRQLQPYLEKFHAEQAATRSS